MGETLRFGSISVELSHPGKEYFPDEGITKGELVRYYRRVAETIVPYLEDRPLTMRRFPDGIDREGFFQQQAGSYFPDWISTVTVDTEDGSTTHVVCRNAATLVYLANQGCIEPHAWLSRTDRLHNPDQMVFDLDPPGEGVAAVRRAAARLRDLLGELDLVPFLKSTGSRGAHVVVPLDRGNDFEAVRNFARGTAEVLAARSPELVTVEQRKSKRGNRVYLDVMRNAYGQHVVAPYGVRARPGAPVAVPLHWEELEDFTPGAHNLANVLNRLASLGDPWKGMGRRARALSSRSDRLAGLRREEGLSAP